MPRVGVKTAVYTVLLDATGLEMVPLVTVMMLEENPVTTSEKVKVMVEVSLAFRLPGLALMLSVGAVLSIVMELELVAVPAMVVMDIVPVVAAVGIVVVIWVGLSTV